MDNARASFKKSFAAAYPGDKFVVKKVVVKETVETMLAAISLADHWPKLEDEGYDDLSGIARIRHDPEFLQNTIQLLAL